MCCHHKTIICGFYFYSTNLVFIIHLSLLKSWRKCRNRKKDKAIAAIVKSRKLGTEELVKLRELKRVERLEKLKRREVNEPLIEVVGGKVKTLILLVKLLKMT